MELIYGLAYYMIVLHCGVLRSGSPYREDLVALASILISYTIHLPLGSPLVIHGKLAAEPADLQ